MNSKKNVLVTQPALPPLEEFIPYLEKIWANKTLTNGGPFHQQLENSLRDYLGVPQISLFANATIALLVSLKRLGIKDEVITTPYSFVATSHSLLWQGITPVFVDIDPATFALDPSKIEAAITPATTAIMPVHCYGISCDTSAIQKIADKYGLKVIYDAAHAFGVQDSQGSILRHGDLSVVSFHATKVFSTLEGGAIISSDAETKKQIDYLKNFGIADEVTVVAAGINGKMNEISAAFGLLQLQHIDQALARRRKIDALYRTKLAAVSGIDCINNSKETVTNYSYFPILVQSDYPLTRDALYGRLKKQNIHVRRYFYPLISSHPLYAGFPSAEPKNLPVAVDVAEKILCLPIHPALTDEDVERITDLIARL